MLAVNFVSDCPYPFGDHGVKVTVIPEMSFFTCIILLTPNPVKFRICTGVIAETRAYTKLFL